MPDGDIPPERETQARAVDRMTFFSDAVVAIAITLLAIDLPVPSGHTAGEFWRSAHQNSGHYGAFLLSFFAIGAAWSHHHDIFRYASKMDSRLRRLNSYWLLMIVLTPFATKLLTSRGTADLDVHALRFGCYALLQALDSGLMLVMLRHLVARGQAPGLPSALVTDTTWQAFALVLGFALSVPVFFATTYGWIAWIVVPIAVRQAYRLRHRGQPDPEADPDPASEQAA